MSEERLVYSGNPSAVTVLGSLVFSLVLLAALLAALIFFRESFTDPRLKTAGYALLLVPLVILMWKWVQLKLLRYEITTERIKITRGILTRRTDELELYRVKDSALVEPLLFRIFSVGNVVVTTNDASSPTLELRGIKHARDVREKLRVHVEECRVRKGARVTEME